MWAAAIFIWGTVFTVNGSVTEAVSPARLITGDRIGAAYTQSTVLQFKREMEGYRLDFIENYMDGYSALCAYDGPEELVCAGIDARPYAPPFAPIMFLRTESPRYATKEGVRVGMTLDAAAKIYGETQLSYSVENESREYVDFAKGPKGIAFRPGRPAPKYGFAGIYASSRDIAPLTPLFHEDAIIKAIEISGW